MNTEDTRRPRAAIVPLVVVTALLLLAACTGSDRPSTEEWQPVWQAASDAMPTLEELGDPPDSDICGHALGILRAERPDLLPAPDPALDVAVEEWVIIAEDAMFECPPSSHEIADLAQAYEELARLEAEVNAVLDIDLNTG